MSLLDRRRFLGCAAGMARLAEHAAEAAVTEPETLVTELHQSLSAEQRKAAVLPYRHELRTHVEDDWHVVPRRIGALYTLRQQAIIREIFRGLHSPQFADKAEQRLQDDAGGLANCSAGIFGEPGAGPFEFVLTGTHCTLRCGRGMGARAAFGGPIFYGHQAPDPRNVYRYQAASAGRLFQSLTESQRRRVLRQDPREEKGPATVAIKKPGSTLAGVQVQTLAAEQRKLVEQLLADLVMPFRKQDSDDVMRRIAAAGEASALWIAFYETPGGGQNVWQLESPSMVWYFRGHPHVHAWVNVA